MADINLQYVSTIPYYSISGMTIDNNGVIWISCYESSDGGLYYHVYKASPPNYIFAAFTSISAANVSLGGIATLANNDKWIAPWVSNPIIIDGTTEAVSTFSGTSSSNRHDISVDGSNNLWITCLSNGMWKKAPGDANFTQKLVHPAAYPNAPYGLTGSRYNPADGFMYIGVYSSPSSNGGAVLKFDPSLGSPTWINTNFPNVSAFDTFCAYNGDVYCSGTGQSQATYKLPYGSSWTTASMNSIMAGRSSYVGWFTAADAVMFVTSAANLYKTAVPPPPPTAILADPGIEMISVTWIPPA